MERHAATGDRPIDVPAIIVKAGLFIDCTGAPAERNVALRIEGNRIADIRPAGSLPPPGSRVTVYARTSP